VHAIVRPLGCIDVRVPLVPRFWRILGRDAVLIPAKHREMRVVNAEHRAAGCLHRVKTRNTRAEHNRSAVTLIADV
jgi:hypothetical protein